MRRIKAQGKSERGVVAPLTALIMVFLLGMAAFAVDVGTMYSEHAQLQNGADSSALAIAQACAATPPGPACAAPLTTATGQAGANALDAFSNVVTATVGTGVVDVTTQSQDTAGNNHFSLVFARALGIQTTDIRATSQAKFGGFSAANVVPLTFSKCESDPGFTKGIQFFPSHGSGLDDDPGYECKEGPSSGWELPGGFGWLDHPTTPNCTVLVDVANPWVTANTGNNFDGSCTSTFSGWQTKLAAGQTVEVLIPIFSIACPYKGSGTDPCSASPYGKNGKAFRVEAFAQISVKGWHFTGGGPTYYTPEASALDSSLKLKNSDTGLFGTFIKRFPWRRQQPWGSHNVWRHRRSTVQVADCSAQHQEGESPMKTRLLGGIVALVLAIVGTLLLVSYVQGSEARAQQDLQPIDVLVVEKQIPEGSTLDEVKASVRLASLPAASVPNGALKSFDGLDGKVTSAELVPGEPLLGVRLVDPTSLAAPGSVPVPAGMQEISVQLGCTARRRWSHRGRRHGGHRCSFRRRGQQRDAWSRDSPADLPQGAGHQRSAVCRPGFGQHRPDSFRRGGKHPTTHWFLTGHLRAQ